jgi:hypothetical protein
MNQSQIQPQEQSSLHHFFAPRKRAHSHEKDSEGAAKHLKAECRLAIIGSRGFRDSDRFEKWLADAIALWGSPDVVVSGGLGESWAEAHGVPTKIFLPDWVQFGKSAGLRRNVDIINSATHVLAFPSRECKATQHSIKLAEKSKKPLLVHWIDQFLISE